MCERALGPDALKTRAGASLPCGLYRPAMAPASLIPLRAVMWSPGTRYGCTSNPSPDGVAMNPRERSHHVPCSPHSPTITPDVLICIGKRRPASSVSSGVGSPGPVEAPSHRTSRTRPRIANTERGFRKDRSPLKSR